MARYVHVPPSAFISRLTAMGFSPVELPGVFELVYQRRHHRHNHRLVRIFTTIDSRGDYIRGKGSDAIRVVGLTEPPGMEGKTFPVGESFKILRAGSNGAEGVLDRVHERAREVYASLGRTAGNHARRTRSNHG